MNPTLAAAPTVHPDDRDILRGLAEQVAVIAALPVQREKARLWGKLNDLRSERPMVWITEIPWHEPIGRYTPFDGDGMLHRIAFHDGRATYRNRFVRTDGFLAEQEAAESLWTGMLGAPEQSKRADGWGAR